MAVCIFWLLTYVGHGLDLAVGNRPVIIVQGAHDQDYRHGGSIRKKSELSSVDSNLLHLRIYPSDDAQRDGQSNWLLLNEEPRISSWTPAGILIDDIMREPRELQTVFFALSPAVLNVLYSEYVTSQSGHASEPFLYDESNLIGQHQRAKKLWIDCKHSRNTVTRPLLVCDEAGRKTLLESRQSNYDDLFEQRLSTATNTKTDLRRADALRDYHNGAGGGVPADPAVPGAAGPGGGGDRGGGGGGGGGVGSGSGGGGGGGGGFVPKPFLYKTNKLAGKRNQISVGRRSIDLSGESITHQAQMPSGSPPAAGPSIASQLMLRSTRGSIQYDVPQIECPVSEDGMERFACPTADRMGRYHCIDDHVLCDGFIDCPTGEDEDRQACMFYKTTKAHLDVLADAILRWARGR